MPLTDQADLLAIQAQRTRMVETFQQLADRVGRLPLERAPAVFAVLRPHLEALRQALDDVADRR